MTLPDTAAEHEGSYTDSKGRTRWRINDWVGQKLNELHDFLVIGGYDQAHAARYPRLAHEISRSPEKIDLMASQGRLREIPGVGETIAAIIDQIVRTGTSKKFEEWAEQTKTPRSVLELTSIPGLGARTIRILYAEHGIDSLDTLKKALQSGSLEHLPGLGPKMLETMRTATHPPAS